MKILQKTLTLFTLLLLVTAPASAMTLGPDGISFQESDELTKDPAYLKEVCSDVSHLPLYDKCLRAASSYLEGDILSDRTIDVSTLRTFDTASQAGIQSVLDSYIQGALDVELSGIEETTLADKDRIIAERQQAIDQLRDYLSNLESWLNSQASLVNEARARALFKNAMYHTEEAQASLDIARKAYTHLKLVVHVEDATFHIDEATYFMNAVVHEVEQNTADQSDLNLDAVVSSTDFGDFAGSYFTQDFVRSDLDISGVANRPDLITFLDNYQGPLADSINRALTESSSGGSGGPDVVIVDEPETKFGDINLDDVVDCTDLKLLADVYGLPADEDGTGDLSQDGFVDELDFKLLRDVWEGPASCSTEDLHGDVTQDGLVNFDDMESIYKMFGTPFPEWEFDVNIDAVVSYSDWHFTGENWYSECKSMIPVLVPVDEPVFLANGSANLTIKPGVGTPVEVPWLRCMRKGDVVRDGSVNMEDVLFVLEHYHSTRNRRADINNDDYVDFADIIEVLNRWTAEPEMISAFEEEGYDLYELFLEWLAGPEISQADFDVDLDVDRCDWIDNG